MNCLLIVSFLLSGLKRTKIGLKLITGVNGYYMKDGLKRTKIGLKFGRYRTH